MSTVTSLGSRVVTASASSSFCLSPPMHAGKYISVLLAHTRVHACVVWLPHGL
jgi:hypothetical protein